MENVSTFEENMKKLEDVVSNLEKGDITLEKAVEFYGEGVRLAELCKKQLNEAKLRITEDTSVEETAGE